MIRIHPQNIARAFDSLEMDRAGQTSFTLWTPLGHLLWPDDVDGTRMTRAAGWTGMVFDHRLHDAESALTAIMHPPPASAVARTRAFRVRASEGFLAPSRQALRRRASRCLYPLLQSAPSMHCVWVRLDEPCRTDQLLHRLHHLTWGHAGGYARCHSSILVTVSADRRHRSESGNFSSGFVSSAFRPPTLEQVRGFLRQASLARDCAMIRLEFVGRAMSLCPSLISRLASTVLAPRESAILTSIRLQHEVSAAHEGALFLELPVRNRRAVSISLLRDDHGANLCVSGYATVDRLASIATSVAPTSTHLVGSR